MANQRTPDARAQASRSNMTGAIPMNPEPVSPVPPNQNLALTLSGGGFRAALFHLGVVRFLYEANLLPRVRHICAVSGGSILAAHLALNWELYTGDTEKFKEAA